MTSRASAARSSSERPGAASSTTIGVCRVRTVSSTSSRSWHASASKRSAAAASSSAASTSGSVDRDQATARFSSASAGARVAVSIGSRAWSSSSSDRSVIVDSLGGGEHLAGEPRLGRLARERATTSASTASSVRVGSWWNSASRPTSPATRDVDRVLDGAVTPPHLVRVLLLEVLGVVDQQVGAAHERRCAARPRGRVPADPRCRRSAADRRSARDRWSTRRSRRRPRCGTRASARDGGGSAS